MSTQTEIQEDITSRIIEGLQNGIVPWKKPWRNDPSCGAPANVISDRLYSGINPLLLDLSAQANGFASKYWGTFEQWKSLGGNVRRRPDHVKTGQWGTNIVFFRQVKKSRLDKEGTEKIDTFPLMRFYTVFNLDQVDGKLLDHLRPNSEIATSCIPRFEEAEQVIAATGADIRFGGNRAVYTCPVGEFPNHTDGDFIRLPNPLQFTLLEDFYSTAFHELVHWSEFRLKWEGSYAMGELIAEIGACLLSQRVNIPSSDNMENHLAYVAEWLKHLENDRKYIFKAASQASKAADFIFSFSRTEQNIEPLMQGGLASEFVPVESEHFPQETTNDNSGFHIARPRNVW